MSKDKWTGPQDPDKPGISLERKPAYLVGRCDACLTDPQLLGTRDSSPDSRLVIDFPIHYIALCARHEGELITKLVNNYMKRMTRTNSDVGFRGTIKKDEEFITPKALLPAGNPPSGLPEPDEKKTTITMD